MNTHPSLPIEMIREIIYLLIDIILVINKDIIY